MRKPHTVVDAKNTRGDQHHSFHPLLTDHRYQFVRDACRGGEGRTLDVVEAVMLGPPVNRESVCVCVCVCVCVSIEIVDVLIEQRELLVPPDPSPLHTSSHTSSHIFTHIFTHLHTSSHTHIFTHIFTHINTERKRVGEGVEGAERGPFIGMGTVRE